MSVGQYGTGHEYVTIIDSAGVETVLPVRGGGNVARQSLAATTQVVTVGDNSRRQDLRTPQVILTDQSGGMGEFAYTETEGILTFTQSDCETRYAGEISMLPVATSLGDVSSTNTGGSGTTTHFVEYLGQTNAKILIWRRNAGTPMIYNPNTSTLSSIGTASPAYAYAKYKQFFILANGPLFPPVGLYTSTDGVTWTSRNQAGYPIALCTHDNKLYAWAAATNTLQWTTDPTSASSWATSGSVLSILPSEAVKQIFEWRDKSGRAAVYVLTNRRLIWYDEDADAFSDFYDFSDQTSISVEPYAHVWRRDGNLYVSLANNDYQGPSDTVLWFSGTTNTTGPSVRGGLPLARMVQIRRLVGGLRWLYAWGDSTAPALSGGVTNPGGAVLAMNDQQGWHTIYNQPATSATLPLTGGGYNNGVLWYVAQNILYEMPVADSPIPPSQRVTDRTYNVTAGPFYHEYAYTDGGTENMDKQAIWVTIQARRAQSGQQGLETGGAIVVQYKRDTESTWTTIGTLTSANTFPAVLPIANGFGVAFKQIKLRIGLSSTQQSIIPLRAGPWPAPFVTSVALAFTRRPVQRYAYQIPVDLTPRAFGQLPIHVGPGGLNAAAIRTRLEGYTQPGQMVKLRYGGNTTTGTTPHGTTVGPCQLTLGGSEGPTWGPGQYVLTLTDLSAPSSG